MWRAAFAATLAAGMAASTFVQFFFGNLAPFLLDEFEVSRSRLGLLTTVAFVVGGLGSLPAGRLVDRLGGRRVLVGLLGLVIVATLGMALAPSFTAMLVGAGLAGGALAGCNPTTNKLIADHLEPGERGWIVGIKQAGVQFGAFFTGAILPFTAVSLGWRWALAVTIAVPAAAIAATLLLIPSGSGSLEEPRSSAGRTPLGSTVWWMTAYAALMGAGVAAIGAWIPLYAQEGVGLTVKSAGVLAAAIGVVGIASRVAWGWGTERIGQFSMPLAVMGLGSTIASLLLMAAPGTGQWLLWVAAVLFGASAVTWNAVGMLAIVAEVDSDVAGTASGMVLSGFYAGFVVSPILFGYSVDRTGGYVWGWGGIALVFFAATAVAVAWDVLRRKDPHMKVARAEA